MLGNSSSIANGSRVFWCSQFRGHFMISKPVDKIRHTYYFWPF